MGVRSRKQSEEKQMKKRKKIFWNICSIMVIMMLALTSIKAAGGTIEINLKDLPQREVEKAGVTFTMYKVGTMSDDGKADLYETYDMSLPDTAEGLQKLAQELVEQPGKEKVGKQMSDEKGYLSFHNVENGIYLLVPSDMERYGKVDPFIVTLPMYEDMDDGYQGPSYHLQIEPKASPNNEPEKPNPPVDPDEPTPPIEPEKPTPPEKPEEPTPDHPTTPVKPGTPDTSTTTTNKNEEPTKDMTLTQTSDTSQTGLYALLVMLSGLGMYIAYSKYKKGVS